MSQVDTQGFECDTAFVYDAAEDEPLDFVTATMRIAPSWLFSLLVHVGIVLALAMLAVPTLPPRTFLSIESLPPDEIDELEPLVLEDFDDDAEELELGVLNPVFSDPVMANLPAAELSIHPPGESVFEKPAFFGTHVSGKRIAFVIDRSGSMRGKKFRNARKEVLDTLSSLNPTQKFYVVFFDRGLLRMFGDKGPKKMLPATPDNLKRFNKWVSKVDVGSGTMPFQAMKVVMALRPDTLFLLTDGSFDAGDKTVAHFSTKKSKGFRIHTIGIEHRDDGTLEKLAKTSGGTFRAVQRDDEKTLAKAEQVAKSKTKKDAEPSSTDSGGSDRKEDETKKKTKVQEPDDQSASTKPQYFDRDHVS